jgi:type I restriction enzyme S subunit
VNTWPTVVLGEVAAIERSSVQPEQIKAGTIYVGLEHIDSSGAFLEPKPVDAGVLASSKFYFTAYHVLYGKLRPYLAKIACPDFSGICSTDIVPILPGPRIERRYLFHFLRQPSMVDYASSRAVGVNLPRLSPSVLEGFRIPLPPVKEQRRIAEVLDRAEALRAKRRASLSQLDILTQSLFLDLLQQAGQNVSTVSIDDGMEAIIDYRGKSPTKTESGIPLVTARIVKGGELLEPNEFIAEEDYDAWMRRGFPKPGDVLFTTEAPLGEVAQLDGRKVALAQRLLVLRGKPSLLDNTFLKYALTAQDVRKQINARATGSTVRGIRQRELRQVRIPVPPLTLQRDFARRVIAVEKLKAAHSASLAELHALFRVLQHRAFQGEL